MEGALERAIMLKEEEGPAKSPGVRTSSLAKTEGTFSVLKLVNCRYLLRVTMLNVDCCRKNNMLLVLNHIQRFGKKVLSTILLSKKLIRIRNCLEIWTEPRPTQQRFELVSVPAGARDAQSSVWVPCVIRRVSSGGPP